MKRAGNTRTISISVDAETLSALKKLAKRLHGGNVSRTVAELALDAQKLEAQDAFIEKYAVPPLTAAARERIDAEWAGEARKKKGGRRKAA